MVYLNLILLEIRNLCHISGPFMKSAQFNRILLGSFVILAFLGTFSQAGEVVYDLTIAKREVNVTGKSKVAITVNGGIPAPTLRFSEGDMAVMHVHNEMDVPASIHWHGMLVPPEMDGVPGISFPGIPPHSSFTYRFPIRQTGTYWYHSHTGLQEQLGLYGPIVVTPNSRQHGASEDHVVMLSDWSDRSPEKVMKLLRRGSEWMAVEKGSSQTVLGAVKTGKFIEFWKREAMRMPPMDLADVAYDAFLINGKQTSEIDAQPGEIIRLRVIDGSASTSFHLQYAGGPITIITADGQPVEPLILETPLFIAVAETYDVIVKVPAVGSYEFRATAHDGSGQASIWLGQGEKHAAPDLPKPFLYDTMDMFSWERIFALTPQGAMGMTNREVDAGKFDQPGMNMDMEGMEMDSERAMPAMEHSTMEMPAEEMTEVDHSKMEHGMMEGASDMQDGGLKENPPKWYDFLLRDDAANFPLLASDSMTSRYRPFSPYMMLRSERNTEPSESAPRRTVRLTLDGDMTKYVWQINNRILSPENDIHIKKGEVVTFVMINRTMMHHPMHLHGHFFRVINGQGERSPLKHTVNVEPMSTTVIEFEANEFGDWFFHCHLLYHMQSGMARVVRYDGYSPDAATADAARSFYADTSWKLYGTVDALSSESQGKIVFSNILNSIALNYEAGWQDVKGISWEGDTTYNRYINRFTSVFAGAYGEGIDSTWEKERIIAGIHYLLPVNLMATLWIDSDGGGRISVGRELMLTPRIGIFGEVEYDSHDLWSSQAGASYRLSQSLAVTGLWDSDYGMGAGFTLRF